MSCKFQVGSSKLRTRLQTLNFELATWNFELTSRHSSLMTFCNWNRERERGALADFGLDADFAAVEFDELARDVEAEPRPLLAARGARAGLRVLVEDVVQVFARDADACVLDGDADERALARRAPTYAPAFGRELQSVRDEGDEYAPDLRSVGAQRR